MLETALSIVAWVGVILIQALVHYKLAASKRLKLLTADSNLKDDQNGKRIESKLCLSFEDEEGEALVDRSEIILLSMAHEEEEDVERMERPEFLEMLSLTGSEMIKSNRSLETLIQEQIVMEE